MKFIALFLFLIFGSISFSQGKTQVEYDEMLNKYYKRTVPFIQPQDLYKRMLNGEKIHLLDTRENKEYEISALNGAIHVGFLFFSKNKVENFSKNDMVVVYCTIGARSESIGEKLLKNGFTKVYNLYGGIIQWVNEGLPLYHKNQKTNEVHVYSKKWGQWLNKGKARY